MADEEGEGSDPNKNGKTLDKMDIQMNITENGQNETPKDKVPVPILKKNRVQFSEGYDEPDHPGVSYENRNGDDSNDDSNDEDGRDVPNEIIPRPQRKSIMKSRSLAGLSTLTTFSAYSTVSIDPRLGILTAVVIFKILFVDICASVGDNVTDFLQGFNLVFDLRKIWDTDDENRDLVRGTTWRYGVLVLLMNWVPGIVAAIHILLFHREEYFAARKEETPLGSDEIDAKIKKKRKARKQRFIYVLLACLFFYPIVPPIVHFLVMCKMSTEQDTIAFSRTQLFAGIARSISGCLESPLQLLVTLWLMFTGVIDTPFAQITTTLLKDKFDNTLPIPEISSISMFFSFFNIVTSAIQINIMSVYIGDIKNMEGLNKFMNMACSHLPFFLSSILFRLSSYAYLWVYLDAKLPIPIILIMMANLFIGLATYGMYRLPKKINKELDRIRKERRKKENNPSLIKMRKNKTRSFDSPIWLNTILSLFVPCCFVHEIDHVVVQEMKQSYQDEREKILKAFQKRILRFQSLTTTLIHLFFIAIVFFGVNFNFLNHNYNIFYNTSFNIYSAILFAQGIISLFFCWNLDIFEMLGLNKVENTDQVDNPMTTIGTKSNKKRVTIDPNEPEVREIPEDEDFRSVSMDEDEFPLQNTPKRPSRAGIKGLITFILSILVVSPLCIGIGVNESLKKRESSYVIVKAQVEASSNYTIRITNAFVLNSYGNTEITPPTLTGYLQTTCHDCSSVETKSNMILMADLGKEDTACKLALSEECVNKYKGIILLEPWKFRTSSPYPHKVCNKKTGCYSIRHLFDEKKFPIISISEPETEGFREIANNLKKDKDQIDISFQHLYEILDLDEMRATELFKIDCQIECFNILNTENFSDEYYIGCDGIPRIRKGYQIICRDKGRECPELESWRTTLPAKNQEICDKKEKEEKEGQQSKYPHLPPLTCRLNNNTIPYIDKAIRYCLPTRRPFVKHQESPDGIILQTKDCTEDISCTSWGEWSTFPECLLMGKNYRFCRKSPNCVLYQEGKEDCVPKA